MTSLTSHRGPVRPPGVPNALAEWGSVAAIAAGLAGIVAVRLAATRAGLDPLAVGAAFGVALGALGAVGAVAMRSSLPVIVARPVRAASGEPGSPRQGRRLALGLVAGVGAGLALAALTLLAPAIAGTAHVPGLGRPAAPLVPWALVTILVASAEEGLLRGVLLDRLERRSGLAGAIVLTSVAFALIHVPLYGWHVVPLDLAIGIAFAGLRLSTRTLLAPMAAHAVADLATWWL